MMLLFCLDPLEGREPDADWREEVAAARASGFDIALVDHDALVRGQDAARAVRRVPKSDTTHVAVYRGWMLRVEEYRSLYEALIARGVRLVNDPAEYARCHHLPESYSAIESMTPKSVWVRLDEDLSIDHVMEVLRPFGGAPVVLKDFVKSRKHEWAEACFIPSSADRAAVGRVVARFRELQGGDIAGGLVFRAYERFEPIGTHSKSGMPITREYRIFFLDGMALAVLQYWDEGDYSGEPPPLDRFGSIAARVGSRFFTMDVVRRVDGEWRIVELGDGQVAGLPQGANLAGFYGRLADSPLAKGGP